MIRSTASEDQNAPSHRSLSSRVTLLRSADFFLVLLALIFFLIIGDNDIVIMCTIEFGLIIRANVVN